MAELELETKSVPTVASHSALIIDDNFFNRDIFRIALEFAGYRVEQAESGQDGLDILSKKQFNLLVLDLQMPNMDGRTVLKQLCQQGFNSKMWIVVVTANAHMATDDINDLAHYVMYKPVNVSAFSDFAIRLKQMSISPTNPV